MSAEDVIDRLRDRGLLFYAVSAAVDNHATVDEVCGRDRHGNIVRARHAAWCALRERGLSFPAIGRLFDVDHTTVMSAVRKFERGPRLRIEFGYGPRT